MCRLLAYAGPPLHLDTLLVVPDSSLISQSRAAREAKTVVNGDGCGIGWYGSRAEPGIYRNILPAWSDSNLVSLCRTLESRLFIAHVRSATTGEVSHANCHPFAAGKYLFAHNGQIGGYETVRRAVEAMIPDSVYPLRRGTSDSEAIFLAAVGHGLHRSPLLALEATLSKIHAICLKAGIKEAIRVAALISDGRSMHAVRWSSHTRAPSLYWRPCGEGIVIASEPYEDSGPEWIKVAAGTAVTVDTDSKVKVTPFDPLGEAKPAISKPRTKRVTVAA